MITVGLDNLVLPSEEAIERTAKFNTASDVNTSDKKWRVGELEFEAQMRMLDNAVSCQLTVGALYGRRGERW